MCIRFGCSANRIDFVSTKSLLLSYWLACKAFGNITVLPSSGYSSVLATFLKCIFVHQKDEIAKSGSVARRKKLWEQGDEHQKFQRPLSSIRP